MKILDIKSAAETSVDHQDLLGCVREICQASAEALHCTARRANNPQIERAMTRVKLERQRLVRRLPGQENQADVAALVGDTCASYRAYCSSGQLRNEELRGLIELDREVAQALRGVVRDITATTTALKLSAVLAEFQMSSDELRADIER
ncbi:MAG: hypothetical protein ACE37D_05070 [Pseudomonadales bacterium]